MKENDIKVSIIMGIYNCENTIKESIESIINQTYTNWELIMCDDCSSDNTYNIAKQYQEKLPSKIKLIKNEKNLKLASTLNKCLEYVEGEYVARMDADDISLPKRFEKQVDFLNKNIQYQVVGSRIIPFDENGENGIRDVEEFPTKESLKLGPPFAHPSIMMRREVYEKLGGYRVKKETTRCEDTDLWFRFYNEGFKGYNIQIPLLKYRESKNDFKRRRIKHGIEAMKVYYSGYKLLKYPKKYYVYLFKPIISSIIPSSIISFYHKSRDKRKFI